jgi:murein DD-endopeptidase MepM/ murein hydrolase activator NlpD
VKINIFLLIFIVIVCAGCNTTTGINPRDSAEITPESTLTPSLVPSSSPITATATIISTQTPKILNKICSPLQGETLKSLTEIISQPFKMPPLGSDDRLKGHMGVDFSYYRRNDRIGIQGLPVFSSLEGKVIAVLNNKEVYGNAIIIETPLDQIPANWTFSLQLPAPAPTVEPPKIILTCPKITSDPNLDLDLASRSLYLLYAHLDQPPSMAIGDMVSCGQQIGAVGNTGYSTNPHLHFEVRIGPAGAVFDDMDHYIASASETARYNYCIWRVSNLFQLTDPMNLLKLGQ